MPRHADWKRLDAELDPEAMRLPAKDASQREAKIETGARQTAAAFEIGSGAENESNNRLLYPQTPDSRTAPLRAQLTR